jgi:hypothetical protein
MKGKDWKFNNGSEAYLKDTLDLNGLCYPNQIKKRLELSNCLSNASKENVLVEEDLCEDT